MAQGDDDKEAEPSGWSEPPPSAAPSDPGGAATPGARTVVGHSAPRIENAPVSTPSQRPVPRLRPPRIATTQAGIDPPKMPLPVPTPRPSPPGESQDRKPPPLPPRGSPASVPGKTIPFAARRTDSPVSIPVVDLAAVSAQASAAQRKPSATARGIGGPSPSSPAGTTDVDEGTVTQTIGTTTSTDDAVARARTPGGYSMTAGRSSASKPPPALVEEVTEVSELEPDDERPTDLGLGGPGGHAGFGRTQVVSGPEGNAARVKPDAAPAVAAERSLFSELTARAERLKTDDPVGAARARLELGLLAEWDRQDRTKRRRVTIRARSCLRCLPRSFAFAGSSR